MGLLQLAYPPHIRVFSIMPYPIPDNLDNIEGWRWYLVPLPDDDQMIQVAWGMWSELTHFWNWGKEGPVPEQSEKAAQLWAAALYEAWRIRDMGFPDIILTYLDEVEPLLEAIRDRPCCEDGALYEIITDPDGVVQPVQDETGQDIEWEVGDPPGDAGTWAEATLERCAAAEAWAANLHNWIAIVRVMHALPSIGIMIVLSYLLSGLIALKFAVTVGAFGVAGAAAFREQLLALFNTLPDYDAAEGELEDPDVVEKIVCAIITSTTPAGAESAIDAALAAYAPNAAPMIEILPLRWMMAHIFNLDVDSSGFGGPCRECGSPVEYSDYTRFGTTYDGLGSWTGGVLLESTQVRHAGGVYNGNNLVHVIPAGSRQDGWKVKVTITSRHMASTTPLGIHIVYGSELQQTFTVTVTSTPAEYVREHTISGTSLEHPITIYLGSGSAGANIATREVLIEVLNS